MNTQPQTKEDASHFTYPLEKNRDFRRVNRACMTLQANIMSHISLESMKNIKRTLNTTDFDQNENQKKKCIKSCNLGIKSGKESTGLFNKCQRTVSKVVAERYSSSQHNLYKRCKKFGENVQENSDLSPCINNEVIAGFYRLLLGKDNDNESASEPPSIIPSQTPTDNPSDEDIQFYSYLDAFVKSSLPVIQPGYEFNTPYEIGAFLASIHDGFNYNNRKISVFTIITFLINAEIVPLKKSSLYRILELYITKDLEMDAKWSGITTPGKNPMLSAKGFNFLVDFVQNKTLGGASMTLSKIKELVKEKIRQEWKNRIEIPSISKTTLQKYASRVMMQKVFNIHASILKEKLSPEHQRNGRSVVPYVIL